MCRIRIGGGLNFLEKVCAVGSEREEGEVLIWSLEKGERKLILVRAFDCASLRGYAPLARGRTYLRP